LEAERGPVTRRTDMRDLPDGDLTQLDPNRNLRLPVRVLLPDGCCPRGHRARRWLRKAGYLNGRAQQRETRLIEARNGAAALNPSSPWARTPATCACMERGSPGDGLLSSMVGPADATPAQRQAYEEACL